MAKNDPLTWSRAAPTVAGFYFFRINHDAVRTWVVFVWETAQGQRGSRWPDFDTDAPFENSMRSGIPTYRDGEWAGPLPSPREVDDAE